MMLAVKHLDPVLGVDIHFIITPPGAVVPIPHPHIGIVFDPFDYLPLIGATVKVNGLPRAQAGTGGRTLPPHFPIGGAFAKPPGNENETFMGSSTVVVEDEPFTYMLLPVLSCQDIGMPSPPRKKGPGAKTLMLPTSIALSIPAGPPVFVGGPPTISLMGLGMQLALGGLLKGLKKLHGLQKGSKRMKELSNRIHHKAAGVMDKLGMKSQRARDRVHKAICTLTGHPVDVVTGRVVTEMTDWELPGPIPLRFTRHYSSSLGWRNTAMGYGWNHSLDLAVWEEDGRVVYRAEDGREIEFDTTGFPQKRMPVGAEAYAPSDRLTLRRVGELRWEVESPDGLVHRLRAVSWNHQGMSRVTSTRNREGFEITYEYDERGLLTWVVDSARRRLHFEHDGKGRLVRVSLPHPTQSGLVSYNRYVYSEAGDLSEAYDPLGHATHYDYAAHLLQRETDRTGLSFRFEYDGEGPTAWCIRTWGDGNIYHHQLHYSKEQGITEVTNSLGHTTRYHWDGRGVVTREVDPLGNEWQRQYDPYLRLTAEIDPSGNTHRHTYDSRGNRTSTTTPDGAVTVFAYDASCQLIHTRNALGAEWWWHHDAVGRLIEEVDPLGKKERYAYDSRGHLHLVTTRDGSTLELAYDDEANLASLRRPDGTILSFKYDRLGRCVRLTDAAGLPGRCQHDLAGRLIRVEGPDGWFWEFRRNEEGLPIELLTPLERIKYGYTGFHQAASEEWNGRSIQRFYDTEDRLVEVRNELGESHHLLYDAAGRIEGEIDFSGRQWRCERDAAGRVTRTLTPGGSSCALEHDALGRLTRLRYADGTWRSYAYDLNGELIQAANQNSSLVLERDPLGQIIREVHGESWVSLRPDADGGCAAIESSLGARIEFKRNTTGGLQEVQASQDGARWSTLFHQGRDGSTVDCSLPANIRVSRTYDQRGLLLEQNTSRAGHTVHKRTYDWRGAHRMRGLQDSVEGRLQFEHGPQGRLSGVTSADGASHVRNPDPAGNIYREAERARKYSAGGLLREDAGSVFDYDAEGRLREKRLPDGRRWRYRYDAEGYLVEVERPDGERVHFTYDALGRRLSKEVGGRRQDYVWAGDVLLHECRPETPPITWVFDAERFTPMARLEGTSAHGIVSDHLGAPLLAVDAAGAIAWQGAIAVDGTARVHDSVLEIPWRWPGQYEDEEVDLVYNRFRYYDPRADRYLTPDPLGLAGGTSPYGYVADPLVFVDPLGLIAGIYDFPDARNGGRPYVGKSVDIDRRLNEHGNRVGGVPNKIAINTHGATGRDRDYLLRLEEQHHMDRVEKKHGPLANKRRAVAMKNMNSYGQLERWYMGGQHGPRPKCP